MAGGLVIKDSDDLKTINRRMGRCVGPWSSMSLAMNSLLQPCPRAQAAAAPDKSNKGDTRTTWQPDAKLEKPGGEKGDAKGKGKVKGKTSGKTTFVLEGQCNGKMEKICLRFQLADGCIFGDNCTCLHVCGMPRKDGKPCMGKHSAAQHRETLIETDRAKAAAGFGRSGHQAQPQQSWARTGVAWACSFVRRRWHDAGVDKSLSAAMARRVFRGWHWIP